MAAKKIVEVDEKVIAIKSQMDSMVYEIKMLDKEEAQIRALLDVRIGEITMAADEKISKLDTRRFMLQQEIKSLFADANPNESKTQLKVSLLSGDVVVKKATRKLEADKGKLLEFAKLHRPDLIKTKTTADVDWAGFKGVLEITDAGIVNTETGEILGEESGISVVEIKEQVVIK